MQAVTAVTPLRPEEETRVTEELEELVWSPDNELSDKVIDQFLVIARSVFCSRMK